MTIAVTLSGSRPSDRLQLSVVAAGFEEALAVADGRAAGGLDASRGRRPWRLALADGAAFAFAAARGDRLACGLADAGAAGGRARRPDHG